MAKVGKFNKLKSALKRSLYKLGHTTSSKSTSSVATDTSEEQSVAPVGLQEVYVGKCRRVYQISSQVIDHPSFQGLISKSEGCDNDIITVGCEVVLFEHLLWMLENIDPQSESLDDLVAFYA